ncbi:protein kinase, partial [candidate division KSB3 bacterium]|nr:protein kinase [candidate division KSB3 bacterium]MBD3324332.1 protein kinase [candidate division KSB3 bacterium]
MSCRRHQTERRTETMIALAGYTATSLLHESPRSLIYRGHRNRDGLSVILKVLHSAYPTPEELARFRREYELTRALHSDHVIQAHALEPSEHTLVMILEDFGGESLARLLRSRKFTLKASLHLAIALATAVQEIHQNQVIHKDLNPSNILWNPQTGVLKLIDFGIATQLAHEKPDILHHPDILEGTLAYISPEQTGRMNRS